MVPVNATGRNKNGKLQVYLLNHLEVYLVLLMEDESHTYVHNLKIILLHSFCIDVYNIPYYNQIRNLKSVNKM
jgi:hypothetical protein